VSWGTIGFRQLDYVPLNELYYRCRSALVILARQQLGAWVAPTDLLAPSELLPSLPLIESENAIVGVGQVSVVSV